MRLGKAANMVQSALELLVEEQNNRQLMESLFLIKYTGV